MLEVANIPLFLEFTDLSGFSVFWFRALFSVLIKRQAEIIHQLSDVPLEFATTFTEWLLPWLSLGR